MNDCKYDNNILIYRVGSMHWTAAGRKGQIDMACEQVVPYIPGHPITENIHNYDYDISKLYDDITDSFLNCDMNKPVCIGSGVISGVDSIRLQEPCEYFPFGRPLIVSISNGLHNTAGPYLHVSSTSSITLKDQLKITVTSCKRIGVNCKLVGLRISGGVEDDVKGCTITLRHPCNDDGRCIVRSVHVPAIVHMLHTIRGCMGTESTGIMFKMLKTLHAMWYLGFTAGVRQPTWLCKREWEQLRGSPSMQRVPVKYRNTIYESLTVGVMASVYADCSRHSIQVRLHTSNAAFYTKCAKHMDDVKMLLLQVPQQQIASIAFLEAQSNMVGKWLTATSAVVAELEYHLQEYLFHDLIPSIYGVSAPGTDDSHALTPVRKRPRTEITPPIMPLQVQPICHQVNTLGIVPTIEHGGQLHVPIWSLGEFADAGVKEAVAMFMDTVRASNELVSISLEDIEIRDVLTWKAVGNAPTSPSLPNGITFMAYPQSGSPVFMAMEGKPSPYPWDFRWEVHGNNAVRMRYSIDHNPLISECAQHPVACHLLSLPGMYVRKYNGMPYFGQNVVSPQYLNVPQTIREALRVPIYGTVIDEKRILSLPSGWEMHRDTSSITVNGGATHYPIYTLSYSIHNITDACPRFYPVGGHGTIPDVSNLHPDPQYVNVGGRDIVEYPGWKWSHQPIGVAVPILYPFVAVSGIGGILCQIICEQTMDVLYVQCTYCQVPYCTRVKLPQSRVCAQHSSECAFILKYKHNM
jgi:hypothetical protein